VWDNIKRGTGVDDDNIAAALTSRAIRDRLFHTQETQEVPATTIQIFTGNSIAAVGDMRTRVLPVSLTADREDPENRDFKHPNPLEWVRAKRNEILNRLYTILALPLPSPNCAPTRMKVWWTEVGRRIEMLSDVRFTDMITAAADDDPAREGLVVVVKMLHSQFGFNQFRTREVIELMYGFVPSDEDEDEQPGRQPRWTSEQVADFSVALRAAMGEREDALARIATSGATRWDSQRLGARLRALSGRPEGGARLSENEWVKPQLLGLFSGADPNEICEHGGAEKLPVGGKFSFFTHIQLFIAALFATGDEATACGAELEFHGVIPSFARVRMIRVADHLPPRAVAYPRRSSSRAAERADSPLSSARTGRIRSAKI
jgi:hypothetical protein